MQAHQLRTLPLLFLLALAVLLPGCSHTPAPRDWREAVCKPLRGTSQLRIEDYISDLDDVVQFSDRNILGWNPPGGWDDDNHIRARGYLDFHPETNSLPNIYFTGTIIRMGHVPAPEPDERSSIAFFAQATTNKLSQLTVIGHRSLRTRDGWTARVTYFSRAGDPYGAIATIGHPHFYHYFILFGPEVGDQVGWRSAFATFHRLVYRYRFTEMKNIIF